MATQKKEARGAEAKRNRSRKVGARRFRVLRLTIAGLVAAMFLLGLTAGAASQGALELAGLVAGIQLLPSLARMAAGGLTGLSGLSLAWLLVLGFTFVFGRFYCSTLCPLGLFQDVAAWVGRVGRKLIFGRKLNPSIQSASVREKESSGGAAFNSGSDAGKGFPRADRILLATAGILSSIFAPSLLAWLEPYSLAVRLGSALFGTAWEFVGERSIRFGIFLPVEPLRFDPAWMAAAMIPGLLVLGAALVRPRLFCRWLCPAGAVLQLAADRSVFGFRIQGEACISCGACQRACRIGAADSPGRRIDSGACLGCFDCMAVCPVGAPRYGRVIGARLAVQRPAETALGGIQAAGAGLPTAKIWPGLSRRHFLLAGGTGIVAAALVVPAAGLVRRPATAALVNLNGKARPWASPPGSLTVERFSRLCLSCGLCARACPSGVLRQGLAGWKYPALLEPYMDYARGFCQFECVACGAVCPSGAITFLSVEDKTTAAIARSSLDLPRCIVIEKGTPCGACAEHCPTGALDMARVPAHRHPLPILDETLCIGCGACETVCPSEPVKALIVSGLAVHGIARVLPERPGREAQSSGIREGSSREETLGEKPESRAGDEPRSEQKAPLDSGADGFPF